MNALGAVHLEQPRSRRVERWLLAVVDAGLAGVVFLVPFLMGGRQALGQLALVALATIVALAWTARQCLLNEPQWRRSRAEWLIVGGLLLLAMQLLAWPSGACDWISPSIAEILPLWSDSPQHASPLGAWRHLSLSPTATQGGLTLFLVYSALFLVVLQRIGELADVERLLTWLALSATAMALFGLVQYLLGNGKFFWFYEHPFTNTDHVVKGAFTNRNHFAQFLALGVGPLLWCFQAGLRRAGRRAPADSWPTRASGNGFTLDYLKLLALAIVVFAGLMSLSRAGMVVMLAAGAVSVGVCFWSGLVGRRFVLGLAGLALLVIGLTTIHGSDGLARRLNDLRSGSLDELDHNHARRRVWAAAVAAIADFPIVGAGVGSHREIYPLYLDQPVDFEYTHAENSYLQLAEETGAAGTALVLAGIAMCGFWCLRAMRRGTSPQLLGCVAAVAASLAANLLHAACDFVWYVPACMAIVVILAACAARLAQLQSPPAARAPVAMPRWAALAMTPAVLLIGVPLVYSLVGPTQAEPHWHRYFVLARDLTGAEPTASPAEKIAELEAVLRSTPDDARAHVGLAVHAIEQFRQAQQQAGNAQSLVDLRDAALASRFESRAALHMWLTRAVGPQVAYLTQAQWHARRGLSLCPLLGSGYLCLSELCFLESPEPALADACLEQALKVRPLQGRVLLAAGNRALLAGDVDRAATYWRRAFHSSRSQQAWLVDRLCGQLPVSFFTDHLAPDLLAFRLLHARYREIAPADELSVFLQRYIETAEGTARSGSGPAAAKAWLESCQLRLELKDQRGALAAIQQAVACDPTEFHVRYYLAKCLLENGQFAQAREHAEWCLQRKCDDASLQRMLEHALKGQLSARSTQRAS